MTRKYGSLRYGCGVKTTVEIDDELLRRAKIRAAEERSTLRGVLEDALRRLLDEYEERPSGYQMADCSVHGRRIKPEFLPWHWNKVADLVYEEREG